MNYPNMDKPAAKVAPVSDSMSTLTGIKPELINCKSQIANPKQISNYNVRMTKTRLRQAFVRTHVEGSVEQFARPVKYISWDSNLLHKKCDF